ncbi:Uncharacterised protein [Vibrio cholerae]|nr:Uncharacterised protein [Vibrio cholerae]CSD14814.1 Uncharacterised protein [Vibrio cholerae]
MLPSSNVVSSRIYTFWLSLLNLTSSNFASGNLAEN